MSALGTYVRRHHLALLALFVALGGTSVAATNALLPKNSVGPRQLRKGAVTPPKVSRKTRQLFRGQRGPKGATGDPGPQGATGPAGPKSIASATTFSGSPADPPTAGLTNYAFVSTPATITVGANQKVLGVASTSARDIGGGQWGMEWAICSRPHGSSSLTAWGAIFSWLAIASQNVAMTTNAVPTLAAGTYDIGACLAVEQTGKFQYYDSSTTLILING